jgi:alpha-D-ribose 1-methylphosphonate 5-triphosphate diphosphatase
MRTALLNAQIVLPDMLLKGGSLLIEDGVISAIDPLRTSAEKVIDLQGAYLLPGLIDLHCDSIEKDVEPRPNALFPLEYAITVADRRNVLCGITTAYHAIAFAQGELGVRNPDIAATLVDTLHGLRPQLLVDNRVHARYEITDPTSFEILQQVIRNGQAAALSFMDHTPGQGQFQSSEAYASYLSRSYATQSTTIAALIAEKVEQGTTAPARVARLAALAKEYQIPLISHDDDHLERIEQMAGLGVQISEFPLHLEAARTALSYGMHTVVGAPNILRGKSQSKGMRALDAVQQDLASCLCSDYAPTTLLAAALSLPAQSELNLPQAVNLVTYNPATALGLNDRGQIAVGKRADCIAVRQQGHYPQLQATWVGGKLVANLGLNGVTLA